MRYLENAVTLELDASLCNGCALCTRVCPHGVLALVEKRAVLADRGACIECGACARNCEPGAIRVRSGMGCAAGLLLCVVRGTDPAEASCGCSDTSDCC